MKIKIKSGEKITGKEFTKRWKKGIEKVNPLHLTKKQMVKIKIPSGERITPKEFMRRWKEGIMKVGIVSQTQLQVKSTWIIIIGVLCGLVITAINFKTLWWLFIILCGALGNTGVQLVSLIQKKNLLKSLEGGT